jgi:hypothetical protein
MAQATQATQTASVATPTAQAASSSTTVPVTSTTTAEGTVVVPTPSGPTPADPTNLLNVFNFFPSDETLARRDELQLEGDTVPEMLYTIAGPGTAITAETTSALAVITYDPTYRQWNLAWQSDPVEGVASPLTPFNKAHPDGFNGGDILRTGKPILAIRTTTRDRKAHLYLYSWDAQAHKGTPLKMASSSGDANARFDGDLDVNLADLNGDGVYEVVADNLKDVQTWKWDGSKFVQGGGR